MCAKVKTKYDICLIFVFFFIHKIHRKRIRDNDVNDNNLLLKKEFLYANNKYSTMFGIVSIVIGNRSNATAHRKIFIFLIWISDNNNNNELLL